MAIPTDGNGGIIGVNNPTAATPPTNPLGGGAPGLWTIGEIRDARERGEWPNYYKQTVVASGGTVSYLGDPVTGGTYVTHTFTSTSSFVLTSAPPTQAFEYLVVAGGGGGGSAGPSFYGTYQVGGNGGAGGLRTGSVSSLTPGTMPITIGGGGGSSGGGGTSTLTLPVGPIASAGGGAGNSRAGGSGGGGIASTPGSPGAGGAGNTPPVSPPQGFPGAPGNFSRAGGGGAGGAGSGSTNGPGLPFNWTGTNVVYAGGPSSSAANQGRGGLGAVGPGSVGGASGSPGGPGIVIIRYLQVGV